MRSGVYFFFTFTSARRLFSFDLIKFWKVDELKTKWKNKKNEKKHKWFANEKPFNFIKERITLFLFILILIKMKFPKSILGEVLECSTRKKESHFLNLYRPKINKKRVVCKNSGNNFPMFVRYSLEHFYK